jgi:hypothetical protein
MRGHQAHDGKAFQIYVAPGDFSGGDVGHTHAVADKQNNVFRVIIVSCAAQQQKGTDKARANQAADLY